ncbi:ABC transporter ATP-binding protein [Candidatus Bathyarchaeota archaeon]|nr:ABC transporter ATP-binding protein [Candidatus Bathyarchaeota archaeon]
MTVILDVRNVKKSYRMGKVTVEALRGVSFSVKEGEFLAVLGPSGSGKSTLLHLIGCLDRPDEGEIVIEGRNVLMLSDDELADLRLKRIGFVFQFFNLLPRLTALENVKLPLMLAGVSDNESREKATKLLVLVGLGERLSHRPSELSGGEQQRVAIARALINDPKLVLADEPTGNLDTKSGWEIVNLMRKLNEEMRQTFIVVTHDPQIAEVADRIIYLKDGLIEGIKSV